MNINVFEQNINRNVCVVVENVKNLDIGQIFRCGQAFRFNPKENGVFCGVAYDKYVEFENKNNNLYIYGADMQDFENIWKKYLDLDTDYQKIIDSFDFEPHLKTAAQFSSGIRILNQHPFETLISFIISQNNNIPRIKKIIDALCQKAGSCIHRDNDKNYYSFPTPKAICELGHDGLFELKTGFRAKYIYDAATKVENGEINLNHIFQLNTSSAVDYLCKIKGVGNKVAMCTLLFGFGKKDAFPIDVWMKKVLCEHYGNNFDLSLFGDNAGVAQQYLFYYERCKNGVFA